MVDTLVIGGGIAGLSLAARCVKHGSVVVLEAESAFGYHSSGRSVAHAHFGLGDDVIRALTALSMERLAEVPEDGSPPAGVVHPSLHIASADDLDALDELEAQHRRFATNFYRIGGIEAQDMVPVLTDWSVNEAVLDYAALKLDADVMLQGHIRAVRSGGGQMHCSSQVKAIVCSNGGWVVETTSESYRAARIVNAAGAWADVIADMAGVSQIKLEPRRRTVISFDGPSGQDISNWPFIKTVGEGFYMLPEGAGRLLASSMDATPCEPCDAAPEELDIATAAHRVEEGTTLEIRRIHHSWAGLRSFARDERPVVGFAPDAPGFFWFAGQGGFGLQTSPALADLGEHLLFGTPLPEEFAGFGLSPELLSPDRLRA
ncbi:FAD-binding oxidoreductase [Erythrobacter sp. SDW2]|uniref:NAD(P)/FAD-dependent oxidoreductase n=1 Tax=Erythrobacter sp. SDW2 TaxID=2907154 RepID=UPI001F188C92|nr:FAD-dependent oxidoreductase [Erythrobacter sp. SDW2]UIP06012.1 FAD-binding oxidoreductase [Erythrobacter sp. SDW2]